MNYKSIAGSKGEGVLGPIFMQCSGKNWPNNGLAPLSGIGAPIWEILDLPLKFFSIINEFKGGGGASGSRIFG